MRDHRNYDGKLFVGNTEKIHFTLAMVCLFGVSFLVGPQADLDT